MIDRAAFRTALAMLAALATIVLPLRASADELLVFAAASLKPAFDEIIATPDARALGEIKASYAASSQLEHQIEAGAPASLFISADRDWMNAADAKGRIVSDTRIDLLGNALVLVAPKDSKITLKIAPNFDLAGAPIETRMLRCVYDEAMDDQAKAPAPLGLKRERFSGECQPDPHSIQQGLAHGAAQSANVGCRVIEGFALGHCERLMQLGMSVQQLDHTA